MLPEQYLYMRFRQYLINIVFEPHLIDNFCDGNVLIEFGAIAPIPVVW